MENTSQGCFVEFVLMLCDLAMKLLLLGMILVLMFVGFLVVLVIKDRNDSYPERLKDVAHWQQPAKGQTASLEGELNDLIVITNPKFTRAMAEADCQQPKIYPRNLYSYIYTNGDKSWGCTQPESYYLHGYQPFDGPNTYIYDDPPQPPYVWKYRLSLLAIVVLVPILTGFLFAPQWTWAKLSKPFQRHS